jgi:hypothetical protein
MGLSVHKSAGKNGYPICDLFLGRMGPKQSMHSLLSKMVDFVGCTKEHRYTAKKPFPFSPSELVLGDIDFV